MSVATVTLSGEALVGVAPHLAGPRAFAALPQAVKLGAKLAASPKNVLRFASYLDTYKGTPPPATVDYASKAAASMSRMYLNDQYGDCVIAGKAHALGVWSANDSDSGGTVLATDEEIYSQYQGICGRGDNGCVITDVLDTMKSKGFKAGGKSYLIDGYVSIDWTNKLEVQVAIYLFGALTLGVNLPSAWTSAAVWDVTNSRIVGGHDVTAVGYNDQGVQIASWGRVYTITWAAFTSTRWLSELYAILAPLWYNADKVAPSGVDVATLTADLAKLGGGVIPDITPPAPVPVPVPPAPIPTGYKFVGDPVHVPWMGGTIVPTGKIVPVTAASAAIDLPWAELMADAVALTFAAWRKDAPGVHEAVDKLFADFGWPLSAEHKATLASAALPWVSILRDGIALARAIAAKDIPAAFDAAMKLLSDLGLSLSLDAA